MSSVATGEKGGGIAGEGGEPDWEPGAHPPSVQIAIVLSQGRPTARAKGLMLVRLCLSSWVCAPRVHDLNDHRRSLDGRRNRYGQCDPGDPLRNSSVGGRDRIVRLGERVR